MPKIIYYTYLLRCKDGTLYCGSTANLKARAKTHNEGRGSKYVRSRGGGTIIYYEKVGTLGDALRRESEIKKLSKQKKEFLIKKEAREIFLSPQ